MSTEAFETELLNWMLQPSVQHSLHWIRVDLTLKQRRETDLKTRRPAPAPTVRDKNTAHGNVSIPAVNAVVPVSRRSIATLDDDSTSERPGTVNVHVKNPSRMSDHYREAEEVRKIAARVVNHLNVHFFRARARRQSNPDKLVCLIVRHDVGTRRHLHMLCALPPNVTLKDFTQALRHVLQHEPFAFVFPNAVDDERSCQIEEVTNLAASVRYNANERKSLTTNPILYIYPAARQVLGKLRRSRATTLNTSTE